MFEGLSESAKHLEAKRIFVRTVGESDESRSAMVEDYDFHAGKQWTSEERAFLQNNLRPVLTFNVTKPIVDHLVGANEDNRMEPRVAPAGANDMARADILNTLWDRIAKDANAQQIGMDVFERAAIGGIGVWHIDLERESADRLKIVFTSVDPFDVHWDQSAEATDLSDARYVFMDKWLSKGEFRAEYPDFPTRELNTLFELMKADETLPSIHGLGAPIVESLDDPDDPLTWFDTLHHQVRVVHMEYHQPVRVYTAFNPFTGAVEEMTGAQRVAFAERFGMTVVAFDESFDVEARWESEVRWLEYTANDVLFDDLSPMPIEGFSVVPVIGNMDYRTRQPYGVVRPLKDPQREINKRWSQMLHLLNIQGQGGLIVEEGALIDKRDAQKAQREPGGMILVKDGKLGTGAVQERTIPQMPEAPARIHEMAMNMISRLSGVHVDNLMEPRGIPEAAATAQLKQRQSLLTVRRLFQNFQTAQQTILQRSLRAILGTAIDQQIEDMLGDTERWVVRQGVVLDIQAQQPVPIRNLRDLQYSVDMDTVAANSSQHLLELQTLIGLAGIGVPVSPDVLIDDAVMGTEKRIELKAFVQQAQEQAAKQAEMSMKLEAAKLAQTQQTAQGAQQEKSQHARTLEQQASIDSEREHELGLLEQRVKASGMQFDQFLQIVQTLTDLVQPTPQVTNVT